MSRIHIKHLHRSIFDTLKSHPKRTILIGVLSLAVAGGAIAFAAMNQPQPTSQPVATTPPKPKPTPKPQPKPQPKFYSPLTGEVVKDEAATHAPVSAIMIENSPQARPQSGLAQAEVVYEAIAEGGITRFLALYQQHKPQLIGPVRSVRMYYIDWLAPYNASVFHVGGSYYALQEIRNGNYRDLDQFFNSQAYWRSSDRYAPHNVYTSFTKLDALNASKGYATSDPQAILRSDTTASKQPSAKHVAVHISGPPYDSSYDYDVASNMYLRSQAGAPHTDREEGQIKARVVVVLKTDLHAVMEDGIREDYRTSGTGQAWVFQDGDVYNATWSKPDRAHQLSFTGPDGKPFALARGTTWITAISDSGGVSWQ